MKYIPRMISNQAGLKVFGFYDKDGIQVFTGYISRYNNDGDWVWSVQKGYKRVDGDKVGKDVVYCLHAAACVLNDFMPIDGNVQEASN